MDIEDVKKNTKILIDGVPYNIDTAEFVKPGKGRAIYRLRLKNLTTGSVVDRTYKSGDKVDEAQINTQETQYLYKEGDHYVFMNTQTFEQLPISEEQLGDNKKFLKENMIVIMTMMGDRPIDVVLPTFVELKIIETEAGTKSATITAQPKSAKLETGYNMDVPIFIKEGDIIKIDTRTARYVERINK